MEMKSSRPSFFKFFFPGNCSKQLKIPSAFTQSIQGALPNEVVLRDRYNNLWQVKVAKVGDELYLQDGWSEFVKDNSMEGGDLLVFQYFLDGLFDTKVFGPCACEKKGVRAIMAADEQERLVVEDDEHEDREVDNGDGDQKGKQDDETSDDETYMLLGDSDGDGEETFIYDDDQMMEEGTSSAASVKPKRKRRIVSDPYGAEIFQSGVIPMPTNPYFLTKINPKRRHELYIPKDVINDFNLNLPEEIFLVDPEGRSWKAKCKKWKDGRIYCKKGWRRLCQMNFVKDDDTCICEFREENQRFCMFISFVRANQ